MRLKLFQAVAVVSFIFALEGCSEKKEEEVVPSRILFFTNVDDGFGDVSVTINGITQTCTKVSGTYGPACGTEGFATFTLEPGDYSFTAQEINGTAPLSSWSSSVTVYVNTCFKYRLQF